MSTVSNKFYVTAISDGSSLSAVLYATKPLSQVINPQSKACIPDWTVGAKQPTVYGLIQVNASVKMPKSESIVWSYNNEPISFGQNGKSLSPHVDSLGNPLFEKTTYVIDSDPNKTMPALKIINNLAVSGNTDNDVISLNGSVEVAGAQVPFTVSVPVRITEQSSSGYYGIAYGDSTVSTSDSTKPGYTAHMYAELYNGADQLTEANSFSTKWYKEGVSEVFATASCDSTGIASVDINASQIDDNVVMRIEFYVNNTKVYTNFWGVDDLQDEEKMYIAHDAEGANNASLREGQSAKFRIWMGHNSDSSIVDPRYTNFQLKMTNSENNAIMCKRIIVADDEYVIAEDTGAGTEYVDITADNVTISGGGKADKGGLATITYAFAHEHGNTVTGLVVATGNTATNTDTSTITDTDIDAPESDDPVAPVLDPEVI